MLYRNVRLYVIGVKSFRFVLLCDHRDKEGGVLFNDALSTFYLRLYGRKEMFYLKTHSTHFIYSYMASDIR